MWWRGPTSALYGRSEPQLTYLQTMGLDDPKTSSLVLGHPLPRLRHRHLNWRWWICLFWDLEGLTVSLE